MAHPKVLNWVGGEHAFLLRIGELRAIDDNCNGGAFAAFQRLTVRLPRFDDIYEPVRLGLIGGGMEAEEARKLVSKVEDQFGIGEMLPIATDVLFRSFHRREESETDSGKTQAPSLTES